MGSWGLGVELLRHQGLRDRGLRRDSEPHEAIVGVDALDLQRLVFAKNAGDAVELQVWRGGEVRSVSIVLEVVEN